MQIVEMPEELSAKFWQELFVMAMQRHHIKSFKISRTEFEQRLQDNGRNTTGVAMMMDEAGLEVRVTTRKEREDLYKLFTHKHEGMKPS